MPSEIIQKLHAIASFEQIDAEIDQLTQQQRALEKEKAALQEVRRVLVIARDGKPAKTWSRKKGASRVTDTDTPDLPEISIKPAATVPDLSGLNSDQSVGERIRKLLLLNPGGLTCGQISKSLRVVYSTVYAHLQKSTDLKKSGDLYTRRTA